MKNKAILSIDRGTSELKVVLFDVHGVILAMEQSKCSILSDKQGIHEVDLDETFALLVQLVNKLMAKTALLDIEIICISVTSYMSGSIFLDEAGNALGNGVLWNDARTGYMLNRWQTEGVLERSFQLSGSQILTGWPIPLLAWWKENKPEVLNQVAVNLSMKDWIRYQLTGQILTDVTEAVLSPGDPITRDYSDEILDLFGVLNYKHVLPKVQEPDSSAGSLLPQVAQAMNLKPGIPVVTGIGDMPSGILGSGVLESGRGSSVIGTTFLNSIITDDFQLQPYNAGMTSAYVENKLIRMVNNTGGGSINYQWFINQFFKDEVQTLGLAKTYERIDQIVSEVELGAKGVMYHPYINSCGVTAPFYNIGARAQFVGIGLDTTREHMIRAIFEGIGFTMRDCYRSVPVDLVDITLTGGGSQSNVLAQILADICNVKVNIPVVTESTALGAAIVGTVGVGFYASYAEAVKNMVTVQRVFSPNQENTLLYNELFELFYEIRRGMEPAWNMRQNLQNTIYNR